MRYIIIGAGAIGGTIGARLFENGHEVVLAARGAHYAALRDDGLRFATPAGVVILPVPVVSGPGELSLRAGDVLILAVKAQDSAAALDAWAWRPVTGGGVAAHALPVFCAQNGVVSERLALRRFRQVYGVCVWLPATHLEPGAIEAQGAPKTGLLPVGRYPAGIDYASTDELARLRGDQVRAEPVSGARRGGGSSWQSLTRGTGSIEADYLNGEIALLGREHGVPTPVNELLQRLANQFAADRRPPGSITAREMADLTSA